MLPTILGTQPAISVISEELGGFAAQQQQQQRNKRNIWFLCTNIYPRLELNPFRHKSPELTTVVHGPNPGTTHSL